MSYVCNVYYLISDKIKGQPHKRYITNAIYYKFSGLSLVKSGLLLILELLLRKICLQFISMVVPTMSNSNSKKRESIALETGKILNLKWKLAMYSELVLQIFKGIIFFISIVYSLITLPLILFSLHLSFSVLFFAADF